MNTPAHVVLNLALLSRNPNQYKTSAIVLGALIPDMVLLVFYAWHKLLGTAEQQIWSLEYYRPFWQAWIDTFNSIPLILVAMLVSWKMRWRLLLLLFASMLLHCLGDLPLHHDDAHRHFFPFLEWTFASPVSYWDPNYHGKLVGPLEILLVSVASAYLWRQAPLRPWVVSLLAIYLAYQAYVAIVWA